MTEIALGEGGEGERGEGTPEDRVVARVADAGGEVLLEGWEKGEEFRIGELPVPDPDVEDGVGERVAELGSGDASQGVSSWASAKAEAPGGTAKLCDAISRKYWRSCGEEMAAEVGPVHATRGRRSV